LTQRRATPLFSRITCAPRHGRTSTTRTAREYLSRHRARAGKRARGCAPARELLSQFQAHDATTFTVVIAFFAAVAFAACLIPASLATRVQPVSAFRPEP
jgi:ABC-type lipoprotein release transport system permease subunit